MGTCENTWGNCNDSVSDGCETSLATTSAHCGACGKACRADEVCSSSTCVPKARADAESWLANESEGFCLDEYNKMLNLCGDVEFCFDPRFMRKYPTGVAMDIGFMWESDVGNLVTMGGDCNQKAVTIGVVPTETDGGTTANELLGGGFLRQVRAPATPGKHLVSIQVNANGTALFQDGLKVAEGGPPPYMELLGSCGPGMVVGQRISYWWEAATRPSWNRMAVFLVHLRENITDVSRYSVAEATTPQPDSVLLFDRTGVSGSRWTAHVGGIVAVGKNAQDETPQLDGGPSGPLPIWKPLAQCTLK
jgi:hypothetical protein